MAFSINSHAGEEEKRFRAQEIEGKHKRRRRRGRSKLRHCKIVPVDHFLRHFFC